jgi:hypothetical protein
MAKEQIVVEAPERGWPVARAEPHALEDPAAGSVSRPTAKSRAQLRGLVLRSVLLLLAGGTSGVGASSLTISFTGPEETVISNGAWGLYCMPDEQMSFLNTNGLLSVWFTGNGSAQLFRGSNFNTLNPYLTNQGSTVPVLAPSATGFDADYAGPGSVIQAANGSDLLMVYHAETQYATCGKAAAKASIGIARSSDGGQTWTRLGQIITGQEAVPQCTTQFNGSGAPSIALSPDGNYFYVYFMDWGTNYPTAIHLARALRTSDGLPGSWFKYYLDDFTQPGIGGHSDPVISRPSASALWAGFHNISFNSYLNRYLAVVTCQDGWYCTSSPDGISWQLPQPFFQFPVAYNQLTNGDPRYLYPTLLSHEQQSQLTTSQAGYLYYGHGVYGIECHHMARRPVILQAGCDLLNCLVMLDALFRTNALTFTINNLSPGATYLIQSSTDLTSSNLWTVVSSFVASGNSTNFSLSLAPSETSAFYRIQW